MDISEWDSEKGIHMQIFWEPWFINHLDTLCFCCRTCQSLCCEGGHYNCPKGESVSKLILVAHLSTAPKIVNLRIAGIDDGDPWRSFKAGYGMVGGERGGSQGLQGRWLKRIRGTVRFGGSDEFKTLLARTCKKAISGGWPASGPLASKIGFYSQWVQWGRKWIHAHGIIQTKPCCFCIEQWAGFSG